MAEFARRRPAAMTGSRAGREAAEEVAWMITETWSRNPRRESSRGRPPTSPTLTWRKPTPFWRRPGVAKNPAGLRAFARRQVMRLHPTAAQRRKKRAHRDGYVHLFQEDSGNAGLSAREMPTAEAVIAWQ